MEHTAAAGPRQHAAVVCNPSKVHVAALRAIVAAEEKRSGFLPTRWFETTLDDPGQQATAAALSTDPSVVIVVGGDGTVRAVAETMFASGVPLALVPVGTGNLLARNLRLALGNLATSIHVAFAGAERSIDIAFAQLERADGGLDRHAFLVMAGIGLDANMAANTNSALKRRIGWLAYAHPIASSVIRNKQLPMHYKLDDARSRSVRAHTVIVGNCGTLTANILLLPEALIDDGLLDVVVLRPKGALGWARIGSRLALNGMLHRTKGGRLLMQATNIRALQYVQARQLIVRFNAVEHIELDGDSFGSVAAAKLSVVQQGLTVRVPHPQIKQRRGTDRGALVVDGEIVSSPPDPSGDPHTARAEQG